MRKVTNSRSGSSGGCAVGGYLGLDLGDRNTAVCVLGEHGEVLERRRVRTEREAFIAEFGERPRLRIALEVGTHSAWTSRLLEELGHEVVVANSRKLALIYKSAVKNDASDAENLARIVRVDPKLMGPIVHRSAQAQADLAVVRSRHLLVRKRTALITSCRSMVKAMGHRLPGGGSKIFHKRLEEWLPDELRPALEPFVQVLKILKEQIEALDDQMRALSKQRYPQTELLRAIPGVGPITALTFVLVTGDPNRFSRNRRVGPYLGLTPRLDESGDRRVQGRITRRGDTLLRTLLVQCAHRLLTLKSETDIQRFGHRLLERGGRSAKRRTVTAVARKLAVVCLALLRNGEVFDPDYLKAPKRVAA